MNVKQRINDEDVMTSSTLKFYDKKEATRFTEWMTMMAEGMDASDDMDFLLKEQPFSSEVTVRFSWNSSVYVSFLQQNEKLFVCVYDRDEWSNVRSAKSLANQIGEGVFELGKRMTWVNTLVLVMTALMIWTLVIYLYVVNRTPEAYASLEPGFEEVADISPLEEPETIEEVFVEPAEEPVEETSYTEESPDEQWEEVAEESPDEQWEEASDVYYEEPVWQETTEYYSPYYGEADASSLRTDGVQYDDGTRYTWYSENVLPGGGLDIPGRHVGEGGYVMDGDGNICVASSDHEIGETLETPYGTAVVYDTGCASGTVDVYTNW